MKPTLTLLTVLLLAPLGVLHAQSPQTDAADGGYAVASRLEEYAMRHHARVRRAQGAAAHPRAGRGAETLQRRPMAALPLQHRALQRRRRRPVDRRLPQSRLARRRPAARFLLVRSQGTAVAVLPPVRRHVRRQLQQLVCPLRRSR